MFFTKAGRVIAWLCVAGSILHYGYLQVVSFGQGGVLPGHPMWNSLTDASKTDMQLLAFGVVIGILAEISMSIATLAQASSEKSRSGELIHSRAESEGLHRDFHLKQAKP